MKCKITQRGSTSDLSRKKNKYVILKIGQSKLSSLRQEKKKERNKKRPEPQRPVGYHQAYQMECPKVGQRENKSEKYWPKLTKFNKKHARNSMSSKQNKHTQTRHNQTFKRQRQNFESTEREPTQHVQRIPNKIKSQWFISNPESQKSRHIQCAERKKETHQTRILCSAKLPFKNELEIKDIHR